MILSIFSCVRVNWSLSDCLSLWHILLGFFVSLSSSKSSLYILDAGILSDVCLRVFLPGWLEFSFSLWWFLKSKNNLKSILSFLKMLTSFLCTLQEIFAYIKVMKIFFYVSFLKFCCLGLIFSSLIHFELIFVFVWGRIAFFSI